MRETHGNVVTAAPTCLHFVNYVENTHLKCVICGFTSLLVYIFVYSRREYEYNIEIVNPQYKY
jgi:hypothetical protein